MSAAGRGGAHERRHGAVGDRRGRAGGRAGAALAGGPAGAAGRAGGIGAAPGAGGGGDAARHAAAGGDPARGRARGAGAHGRAAGRLRRLALTAGFLLLPGVALAQSVSLDLGASGSGSTARLVQLTALIGLLSLAPSLLVMATAFARIVIVLSLLRSAIGAQGIPPNPVLIGLALFLTFFVMQPVIEASWAQGLQPMIAGQMAELDGLAASADPFRKFMAANARDSDLALFLDLARLPAPESPEATPWRALVPAFMVSELKRGFEIGFLMFLPFLVIDLVAASLLMSLGMMMLPPSVVALPFKIIFFVMVDGWRLVSASLVQGFAGQ
ncbi:flagellar biosynthetic protein FliP [Roseomonas nepalensis]|uniref:Flagellar biosynthetic protein FliP n=1 Tax=Muricoccus nepalensis TaxID=1854500 RepID=A0A502GK41_9PROT|nr:flagellar biosynthetic protein FliP [Roseomonas nepalensis]